MLNTFLEAWKFLWVRVVVYVLLLWVGISVLGWGVGRSKAALETITFAFAFAYLTSPIVRWFEKRHIHRALGVLTVFVGLFIFLGIATAMMTNMLGELTQFTNNLPQVLTPIFDWITNLPNTIGKIELAPPVKEALNQATKNLESLLQGFTSTLLDFLKRIVGEGGNLLGFISKLFGGFFQLLTVLTISIYLLYDLPKITQSLFNAIPHVYQPRVAEVAEKADRAFGSYVRGQVLVALCVGLVVSVAMYIALGIGFHDFGGATLTRALSIGFLSFMFNFIPFVGVIISSIPAILLALPAGATGVIAVLVGLWVSNQIEGNLIGPFVMRKATSIHPVTGLCSILLFSSLFGFIGALISGPTTAFLKVLYTDYYLGSRFHKES